MDHVAQKTATYNRLFYPLIVFGLFLALNVVPKSGLPWEVWAWFNYHPLFMSLAFVPLSSLVSVKVSRVSAFVEEIAVIRILTPLLPTLPLGCVGQKNWRI